jgi:hypothetical protein
MVTFLSGSSDESLMQPLCAKYPYDDNIDMFNDTFQTVDGYTFIDTPIFDSTRDVSVNRNTTSYLTTGYNLFDFLVDKQKGSLSGGYAHLQKDNEYISVNDDGTITMVTSKADNTYLRIVINSDDTASIIYDTKYFTVSRTAPYTATFESPLSNEDQYNQQKFEIEFLSDNKITLLTKLIDENDNTINRYITVDSNDEVNASFLLVDTNFPTFTLEAYDGVFNILGLTKDNTWVRYYNQISTPKLNKNTDIDEDRSVDNVKLNYIVTNAHETKINDNTMDVELHGLKNFHTAEYEYTFVPTISNGQYVFDTKANNLKHRAYNKIFTGTRQEEGYENMFLGFQTENAKSVKLEPDERVFFHFPKTSDPIPLSAVGLEYIGALPGSSPFRADRIYKKLANYENKIWWGDSSQGQTGQWRVAWLSGSDTDPTIQPKWVESIFDPGYAYTDGDYFEHFGSDKNQTVIDTLTGTNGNLKLHYDNWSETITDLSPYGNDGDINNFTSNNTIPNTVDTRREVTDDAFNITNQIVGVTKYDSTYSPTNNLSVTLWANTDDWSSGPTTSLAGNHFRGGWRIKYSNGFYNPFFTLFETTNGKMLIFTEDYGSHTVKDILSVDVNSTSVIDKDLFIWSYNNGFKQLNKIDFITGDILARYQLDTNTSYTGPELDRNGVPHIANLTNYTVSSFDTHCAEVDTQVLSADPFTTFTFDLDNNIVTSDANEVNIDNDGSVWELDATSISQDGESILVSVETLSNLKIDKDNNVYYLVGNNTVVDLTRNQSTTLSDDTGVQGSFFLTDEQDETYINFVHPKGVIYKILASTMTTTEFKNIQGLIDISTSVGLNNFNFRFVGGGDPASYDWYRKFEYIGLNNKQQSIHLDTTFLQTSSNKLENKTLVYGVSSLVEGWHHFTAVRDSDEQSLTLYVDANKVNTIELIDAYELYYNQEVPLVIGDYAGKTNSIGQILNLENYGFSGAVDDLRIYDCIINNSDIRHIYLNKFNFESISWVLPTGTQNFIEEIERVFKHRVPGMKTNFYNIRIANLEITDSDTRVLIENIIKDTVKRVAPAYTELFRIIWE